VRRTISAEVQPKGHRLLHATRGGHLQRLFEDPNEKDPIANQRAFEVDEVTWVKEAGDAAEAKGMRERGFEDAWERYVEDVETITAWGFVDCDFALDAAVVGI
jgi:hypothetical protein